MSELVRVLPRGKLDGKTWEPFSAHFNDEAVLRTARVDEDQALRIRKKSNGLVESRIHAFEFVLEFQVFKPAAKGLRHVRERDSERPVKSQQLIDEGDLYFELISNQRYVSHTAAHFLIAK
jgi:hypothetical protein